MKPLMTDEKWEELVYFDKTEKWGDPYHMASDIVYLMEGLRKHLGLPIYVHCGLDSKGHVKDSRHWHVEKDEHGVLLPPWSDAADWSVPGHYVASYVGAVESFLHRTGVSDEVGLGLYPDWYGGGGLHLDTRGKEARWGAVNVVKGHYPNGSPILVQTYVSWAEAFTHMTKISGG